MIMTHSVTKPTGQFLITIATHCVTNPTVVHMATTDVVNPTLDHALYLDQVGKTTSSGRKGHPATPLGKPKTRGKGSTRCLARIKPPTKEA